jgi:PTS system glucose-specific IIA component
VQLHGRGFERLAVEGKQLLAGDPVIRWDPTRVEEAGHSSVCAVVALDGAPETIRLHSVDVDVEAGDLLFEVDC